MNKKQSKGSGKIYATIAIAVVVAMVVVVMVKFNELNDAQTSKFNAANALRERILGKSGGKSSSTDSKDVPSYEECVRRLRACDKGSPFAIDIVKAIVERRKSMILSYCDNVPDNTADVLMDCGLFSEGANELMIEKINKHPRSSVVSRMIAAGVVRHLLGKDPETSPVGMDVIAVIDDCHIFGK